MSPHEAGRTTPATRFKVVLSCYITYVKAQKTLIADVLLYAIIYILRSQPAAWCQWLAVAGAARVGRRSTPRQACRAAAGVQPAPPSLLVVGRRAAAVAAAAAAAASAQAREARRQVHNIL